MQTDFPDCQPVTPVTKAFLSNCHVFQHMAVFTPSESSKDWQKSVWNCAAKDGHPPCVIKPEAYLFCLESKIRHSTVGGSPIRPPFVFCLESKIRHSTIDTVPYFYVQRLIKKYGVRYFYQRSICWGRETSCRGQDLPWKTNILSHWIFVTKRQRTEPSGGIIFWILREWVAILSWVTHARA